MELSKATTPAVHRHRTAMHRVDISRPIRLALESSIITSDATVFDYGCGRGEDLRRLQAIGVRCEGWDPAFSPSAEQKPSDVVNIGYVVNVIEDPAERAAALKGAWALAERVLIVSARLTTEMSEAAWSRCQDGYLTSRETFQKFFEQQELREWIDGVLGVASVPAAPGVFYVFRDAGLAQSYLASRFRRRTVVPRIRLPKGSAFDVHRTLLEPLMEFVASRGRLPEPSELGQAAPPLLSEFRSVKRAFAVVQAATGTEQWQQIAQERSQDLLVYLALARFDGRPSMQALPESLQLDIKGLFGAYRTACEQSDELLFAVGRQDVVDRACAQSAIGKITPEALYLHIDALSGASPLIRVYEGCARAYVGSVDGANILKLHRRKPQVSYLSYPDFETDPHPELRESLKVRFRGLQIEYRDYRDSSNPFILHRKETFVPLNHPLRAKFARLTKQEEGRGLLQGHANQVGTRDGWRLLLRMRGFALRGHQLIRAHSSNVRDAAVF
jgi:DNA phosphorothioation-associated putative methyltransferase